MSGIKYILEQSLNLKTPVFFICQTSMTIYTDIYTSRLISTQISTYLRGVQLQTLAGEQSSVVHHQLGDRLARHPGHVLLSTAAAQYSALSTAHLTLLPPISPNSLGRKVHPAGAALYSLELITQEHTCRRKYV